MRELLRTFRVLCYVLALPLIATAAASAQQWLDDDNKVQLPDGVSVLAASNPSGKEYIAAGRSHTASLDEDGNIHGRVTSIVRADGSAFPLGGLKVEIFRDSQLIKDGYTESDGSFTIKGLGVGPYSFMAYGDAGFVAHGINVIESENPMTIETAAIAPTFGRISDVIQTTKFNPEIRDSNRKSGELPTGANRVQLHDGVLKGKIIGTQQGLLETTELFLFVNRTQVARTTTVNEGDFSIANLQPGVYDFVAAGPNGFAAGSFEAIDAPSNVSIIKDEARVSLAQDAASPDLNIVLIIPVVIIQQQERIVEYVTEYVPYLGDQTAFGPIYGSAPTTYGGPMGGGYVGGGGGRLLGLGALAVGIVALADDDGRLLDGTPSGL